METIEVIDVETCVVCGKEYEAGTCSMVPSGNSEVSFVLVCPDCDPDEA